MKTGRYRSVDIRRLARENLLIDGTSYSWAWKDHKGEVQASIRLGIIGGGVDFAYVIDDHKEVLQHVHIVGTACNYGGQRLWFACPRCSRGCALLYIAEVVACRKCLDLRYSSQSEDEIDRLRRKQAKLEDRLGGTPIIFKPKRMRQATFDRIRREIDAIEHRRTKLMVRRSAVMFPGVFDDMLRLLDE